MQEAVARDILVTEARAWASRIGVNDRIQEIHIRPMKRKWASISTRGRLTLNADLFVQPTAFRREVIVHELVHLKLGHGAHNKLFRAFPTQLPKSLCGPYCLVMQNEEEIYHELKNL